MSGVWVAWCLLWGEDWKELGEDEAGQKLGSTFLPCEGPGWAVVTVVSVVSSPGWLLCKLGRRLPLAGLWVPERRTGW